MTEDAFPWDRYAVMAELAGNTRPGPPRRSPSATRPNRDCHPSYAPPIRITNRAMTPA